MFQNILGPPTAQLQEMKTRRASPPGVTALKEIYRLLALGKQAAGGPPAGTIDFLPFGFDACRPALQTIVKYALQQNLIPRKIDVEEFFDDATGTLGK